MRRPSGDHRAGAALAVIAALLGAGEVQVVAQRVEQRGARVELESVLFAVDSKRDLRDYRRCSTGRLRRVRAEGQRAGRGGRRGELQQFAAGSARRRMSCIWFAPAGRIARP